MTDRTATVVKVDQYTCEGTGFCVRSMASVFSFDDDGVAVADQEAAALADHDELVEVESMCPTTAIEVVG
ncbi:ferredoxin [Nocardioides humi]|uniref:Ferredoxin n=1 Tax=Nocardioides humi TaxID=449461 RepID=A0ABN2B413_9ACTN|nr:ferredoxin [Nocardioides humi]